MYSFDLSLLILPSTLIFFLTLGVAFFVTKSIPLSIISALLKAGIFLIYFGVLFDGTFTFLDDWSYVQGGVAIVDEGIGLSNLAENLDFVFMTSGGEHIVYYLYNAYAFRLFGVGYYAPVAVNIVLTILIAWCGAILGAREFGFTGQWKKIFFTFLLFHPDILAWSNVMNGKDTLILLLHVLLLLSASLFFQERRFVAFFLAIPVVILLLFLRFYVPAIFAVVLVIQQMLSIRRRRHLYWLLGGASILFVAINSLIGHLIGAAWLSLQENLVNPATGFVHMALTPIPFNTDINYSFLNIPALFHWLIIPMVVYGVVLLMRGARSPFTMFFILYLVAFMGLYSINDELTGPRHRVQLDFAWAVLQFMGIKQCLTWMFSSRRTLHPSPTYNA